MKIIHRLITTLLLFGIGCSGAHAETVFTYQGKLGSAGQPPSGAHDFRFRLFDADTGGTQAGSQLTVSPVTVSSGVFTVQLDFGDAPFNSSPRWQKIDVRAAGGGELDGWEEGSLRMDLDVHWLADSSEPIVPASPNRPAVPDARCPLHLKRHRLERFLSLSSRGQFEPI